MRILHRDEKTGVRITTVRYGETWHISSDYISVSIFEHQEPGIWALSCEAARYDQHEFQARPHDAEHAKEVALNIVADRLNWLMSMQKRELELMKRAIKDELALQEQRD